MAGTDDVAVPTLDPLSLLQALGSGGGDPTGAILQQLAGGAADDPRLGFIMRLLDQRRAAEAPAQEDGAELSSRRAEDMQRLTDMVERMYGELDKLRARNDELANALGACPNCFGGDLLCRRCGGRGRPGARAPDPAGYDIYVAPVAARMRRVRRPDPWIEWDPAHAPDLSTVGFDFANLDREISDERDVRV
jgi:hypothetical protein